MKMNTQANKAGQARLGKQQGFCTWYTVCTEQPYCPSWLSRFSESSRSLYGPGHGGWPST